MPRDVLIVDDQRADLENYADAVQAVLKIEPFTTHDPQQALEIMSAYKIKVLVTDNQMPRIKGIDLITKVQDDLHKNARCILITGLPERVSHSESSGRLFRFVDKNDVAKKLTDVVRLAIDDYDRAEMMLSRFSVDKVLQRRSSGLFRLRDEVVTRLVEVLRIDESHVREADWETIFSAQKGVTVSQEMRQRRKVIFRHEAIVGASIGAALGGKLSGVVGQVSAAVESGASLGVTLEHTDEIEVEFVQKIEIASLEDKPGRDGRVLQAREYQAAPVYAKVNCIVQTDCTCCGVPNRSEIVFYLPTSRVATRRIDTFNRGPNDIVYTGFMGSSIVSTSLSRKP